jgi:hypothetical protein
MLGALAGRLGAAMATAAMTADSRIPMYSTAFFIANQLIGCARQVTAA